MTFFVREHRRRGRVLRSLGLYAGVCWLTIQVASVVLPAFEAPIWVLRLLTILAVAGAPVVAAFAWSYGRKRRGHEDALDQADPDTAAVDIRKLNFMVISVLVVALTFSIYVYFANDSVDQRDIEPVSALIADFENATGETIFDGVLEPLLQLSLQAAPQVALLDRNQARDLAGDLDANNPGLPLPMARLVAVRQGIALVLAGSVEPRERGYRLRVTGLEPVSGRQEFDFTQDVAERDGVPEAMVSLARAVRDELGDAPLPDSNVHFVQNQGPYAVTSLEAVKLYADANRLNTAGDFEAAADRYRRAAELQPDWVSAYGGWAIAEFNRGRIEEAEKLFDTTFSLAGDASQLDRLFYLGSYFLLIREDYANALETLSEYVELAPASPAGRNNLAVAAFSTLDFDRAQKEGRRLVDVFPKNSLYRNNLALYAMYAGDFGTAATEATQVLENDPTYGSAYVPLAIAALEDNDPERALELYRRMAGTDSGVRQGGAQAVAAAGIADTELYLGRFEAARALLLEETDRPTDESAAELSTRRILLAESYAASGDRALAIEAARDARALSEQTSVKVAGALVLLAAGELEAVAAVAGELSGQLSSHSRAYGSMLRGGMLRERGRYSEAVDQLRSALEIADLWRVRLELGRAYVEAGDYADALTEFERCFERRGESTAMFLDDVPTYRYLAELPYWTARAQTGLGMRDAAARSYRAFLSLRPEGGAHVDDARARLAGTH